MLDKFIDRYKNPWNILAHVIGGVVGVCGLWYHSWVVMDIAIVILLVGHLFPKEKNVEKEQKSESVVLKVFALISAIMAAVLFLFVMAKETKIICLIQNPDFLYLWFEILAVFILAAMSISLCSLSKINNNDPSEVLTPWQELSMEGRKIRIESYKRYAETWRHWTPHIWSIPTAASIINIAAYGQLFGNTKSVPYAVKIIGVLCIALLNLALTAGIVRTRYMQEKFGDRLQQLERQTGTPPVKLFKFSASLFYGVVMAIIFLLSSIILAWVIKYK